MKNKTKLSVVIIARDEEGVIEDCLKSARSLGGEVVVVDTGSTDKTPAIAKKLADRVVKISFTGYRFADWRNRGLKEAWGDWIFYLDADERVTPLLKEEILKIISHQPSVINHQPVAYAIPRRNFYLGREMHHGGAWPDYVIRLFKKDKLKSWQDKLHEKPKFKGRLGKLQNPMIHLTHRDLASMMAKTINWTKLEADLLFRANHPPVVWWRIFRMMLTKFWERIIAQQAWRDGTEGFINSLFEVFNTFIIYARLWELQNRATKK
jgi:glycosyltransferase involved in cell wall biosynthesis